MPKTLLLADDSVTIQKVVGISFANEDVKLVTVDNGDDALARARELRPDIVLADVVMPGMNGYEVCEAIKKDPELGSIPVLLLTGTFEAFDEERAARAGADGHITKPFEAQSLVDQVHARLASARPSPPLPTPQPEASPDAPTAPPVDVRVDPVLEPPGAQPEPDSDEPTAPSRVSGTSPEAPSPGVTTLLLDDDLDLAGQAEQAFGFDAPEEVHQELSIPSSGPPLTEPAPTVQQLTPLTDAEPETPEGAFAATDPFEDPPTPPAEPATSPIASADGDATRVVLDEMPTAPAAAGESLAPVLPEDLAGEAVLDPTGARDYDVSSSDLGDPLAAGPAVALESPDPFEIAAPGAPEEEALDAGSLTDPGPFAAPQASETALGRSRSWRARSPPCRRPRPAAKTRQRRRPGTCRPCCAHSSTTPSRRSPGRRSRTWPNASCATRWPRWRASPGRSFRRWRRP